MRFLNPSILIINSVGFLGVDGSAFDEAACRSFRDPGNEGLNQLIEHAFEIGLDSTEHDLLCQRIQIIRDKRTKGESTTDLIVELDAFIDNLVSAVSKREEEMFVLKKLRQLCPSLNLDTFHYGHELHGFPFSEMNENEKSELCYILRLAREDGYAPNVSYLSNSIRLRVEWEELLRAVNENRDLKCDSMSPHPDFEKLVDDWPDRYNAKFVSSKFTHYDSFERAILCEIWMKWETHPNDARGLILEVDNLYKRRMKRESLESIAQRYSHYMALCGRTAFEIKYLFDDQFQVLDRFEVIARRQPVEDEIIELCSLSPHSPSSVTKSLNNRINYRKNEWDDTRLETPIEKKCAQVGQFIYVGDYELWFMEYLADMKTDQDIRLMCRYIDGYSHAVDFPYYQGTIPQQYKEVADELRKSVNKESVVPINLHGLQN